MQVSAWLFTKYKNNNNKILGETFSTWTFSKGSFTSKTVEVDGSYQFFTQQYMDYETETDHSYTLYTLLGNSQITVVITTINIDDEPPTLTATMCTMNVYYTVYTETPICYV